METRIPRRSDFPVTRAIPTRWMDNDVYGHVNNVVYYSYFDSAVNSFLLDEIAVDIRTLPAIGVVAETSCRFLKELSFPDQLHVGLKIEKLGDRSVIFQLAVFRGEENEPAAIGRFVQVYIDTQSRRPVPIPPIVRPVLERLERQCDENARSES